MADEGFINEFATTLGVGINATDQTITLADPVPVRAYGKQVRIRLEDAGDPPPGTATEFILATVTNNGSYPWPIQRAAEERDRFPAVIHASGSFAEVTLTEASVRKLSRRSGSVLFRGGSPCADNVQLARLDESNGVITQSTSRSTHRLPRGASLMWLVYPSVRISYPTGPPFGEGSSSTGGNHDIKAAIERPGGSIEPVFFGGIRQKTVEPFGILVSDPVAISEAEGTDIWVRSRASAVAPTRWPYNRNLRAELGEGIEDGVDKVDSGVIAAVTAPGLVPVAIITDLDLPSVAMQGDSIVWGIGDTDIEPNKGFMRRALNRQFGYVALARSGDRAEYQAAAGILRARLVLALGCRYAMNNLGINDVALGGRTAAQLEADLLTIAKMHQRVGIPWYWCTMMPYTSSSNNWADLPGQTINSGNADRVLANDWGRDGCPIDPTTKLRLAAGSSGALRTEYSLWDGAKFVRTGMQMGGHPIAGVFETADQVESSHNSGKWAVGMVYTGDALGIHPSPAGHAAAALATDTSRFS